MSFMKRSISTTLGFTSLYSWALLFLSALISTCGAAQDASPVSQDALKDILKEQILGEVGDQLLIK
jgi:hypothetical protein